MENNLVLSNLYRADLPGNFNEFDILDKHWVRVVKLLQMQKLPPYEIIIHPTCICNLRCKWCIGQIITTGRIENEALEEKLSNPDNMLHVLKNICSYEKYSDYSLNQTDLPKSFRIQNISFSGLIGEPLMAKEAVLAGMKYLVEQRIRTGIFTNGLLIDRECAETLSYIDYVLISIDAGTNDTYNFTKCNNISTKKNVDQILQNISYLRDAKRRNHTNLDINVGFVVNEFNFSEISLAAKLLKDAGVHYFRLKFDIAVKHKLNSQQLDEVRKQIEFIHEHMEDDYFKLVEIHRMSELIASDQKRMFDTCYINKLFAAVGPDGYLYACNYHAKKGGKKHMSLLEHPFSDVWESFNYCEVDFCPAVCDPFKNRANNMLNALQHEYNQVGLVELEKLRGIWNEKHN